MDLRRSSRQYGDPDRVRRLLALTLILHYAMGHDPTQTYSFMCPRIEPIICVPCLTSRSRVRNSSTDACGFTLFTGTHRLFGRCAASQFASAIAASFFCRFKTGFT